MALRALLALMFLAACSSGAARRDEAAPGPPLRPLTDATAAELRAAFDGASGQTRYVVAFSPT